LIECSQSFDDISYRLSSIVYLTNNDYDIIAVITNENNTILNDMEDHLNTIFVCEMAENLIYDGAYLTCGAPKSATSSAVFNPTSLQSMMTTVHRVIQHLFPHFPWSDCELVLLSEEKKRKEE
jgi:hypothetical protein